MALSYRARRRWSLLILVVGLPLYIVAAVTVVNWLDATFGRLPIWAELLVYLGLGFLWALPFRAVFRGIGQADPAKHETEGQGPSA
ncbi:DUF2842 domain-containing protein [Phaeovulum sp. NW3]|uniref:DUF2842 domain-containing protein n=1 Tax=Phaeovulum sp. NW3 TaxID=2934933 RepID=UPI0020212A40|nr:DUF2842 domain-containing protein [Phaeovulum sp. NW3]MCL7464362.1 DUF2842 domain-containing protein [Phaeovulum sp. NW3]